jgi:hypothetical protein
MNSSTPCAEESGGFAPRMSSNRINLSDGGIIAPIQTKNQQKLSEGGITTATNVISKFLPPPLGPLLNLVLGSSGGDKKSSGIGSGISSGFQMLTSPTKLISDGIMKAVIPTNRNVGKNVMGADKQQTEEYSKIYELPSLIGGGIMFSSMSQIANAVPFLGSILQAAKPIIKPIVEAFGLPSGILNLILGGGAASAMTLPPGFRQEGVDLGGDMGDGDGGGEFDDTIPSGGGTISAEPTGKEVGIVSLGGSRFAPKNLSAGSTVSSTTLHHGGEDMRSGLRVRDYLIGPASGRSDGADARGAKIVSPLGFGNLIYKKQSQFGINFLDPRTKQVVGHYEHVENAQHQLDGKEIEPGTLVGTQGGLPGTPSALGSSTAVHLHVEGTDAFHNAVINTYAGGKFIRSYQERQHDGSPMNARNNRPPAISPNPTSMTPRVSSSAASSGGSGSAIIGVPGSGSGSTSGDNRRSSGTIGGSTNPRAAGPPLNATPQYGSLPGVKLCPQINQV